MTKPFQTRGADRRRFHYIYKTTCLITGRYYIGMHSTDDMNDGYMGSGKRLSRSLNKHGRSNHVKEILSNHASRNDLCLKEAELVTLDLIKSDELCMNLVAGGNGHWGWGMMSEDVEAARLAKLSEVWKRPGHRENFVAKTIGRTRNDAALAAMKLKWTPERRAAQSERLKAITKKRFTDYWLTHDTKAEKRAKAREQRGSIDKKALQKAGIAAMTNEARQEMKRKLSEARRNKIWITKDGINKMHHIDEAIPEGWVRGRFIKKVNYANR